MRIYDSRLGKWLSIDFLANKYPSYSPYNFVCNSPIKSLDPNGDVVIEANNTNDKKEQRQQKKVLKQYAKEFRKYVKNLGQNSNELNQLILHYGCKDKKELLNKWDETDKAKGAIIIKFSDEGEFGHQPSANGVDYIHPNGQGNLAGDWAITNADGLSPTTITLSYMLFSFGNYLNSKYVSMPDGSNQRFNYATDRANALRFITHIIGHEFTHVGSPNQDVADQTLYNDVSPLDVTLGQNGLPNMYERGRHWECVALGKQIDCRDVEYGLAVNVYFRVMAQGNCSLGNPQTTSQSIITIINNEIEAYLDRYWKAILNRDPKNRASQGTYNQQKLEYHH